MTVPQLLEHRIDTLFEQLPLVGRLGQAFQEAGHELHLVGGSVRDALMGTLGHDLDFTTDATPDQTEAVLRTQRAASMAHLQALTRRKADAARTERLDPEPDRFARDELAALAHSLVLERLIFVTESEIRWLDHVSIALRRSPALAHRPDSLHRTHPEGR